jgi:hypothetical protein
VSILGVKPNLVLAAIPALFYVSDFWGIGIAVLIGGLFYDLSNYYLGPHILAFLLSFLFIWFLSKKYFSGHRFLSLGVLGAFSTIIFNFLFLGISYLFWKDNLFDYFLSWRHIIEIIINGLLSFLFGGIINLFGAKKS